MGEQTRLTFRITPWRPWFLAITPLILLAIVGVVVAVVAGELSIVAPILLGCAGLALALLLILSLVVWGARWHVDPNGIGGRNNQLVYHHLEWSEIESVEPWMIPGYRYLQVNGGGKRWSFWLPLFLTDMPGLRSAVARYAPPENPLRHYLETHPT